MTPKKDIAKATTTTETKSNMRRLFDALDAIRQPDGTIYRENTDGNGNDAFYSLCFTIYDCIVQALIIAPIETADDMQLKMRLAEYLIKRGIMDGEGHINYSMISGDELEALEIMKQLQTYYKATLTDDQRQSRAAQ